jgi:hypothetical protein
MGKIKKNHLSATALFFFAFILSFFSGASFLEMHKKEPILPSEGLTERRMLSFYLPELKSTPGDTDVFLFQGQKKGGNLLILGGTHPNEPAGFITALVLAENIRLFCGKVVIVPRANNSGFTHNDPQEGNPQNFFLETKKGRRVFRYGSRLTNPIHQWPDPAIYVNPAGQKLSGTETRNLNRCYPGKRKGYLTEKIAYGIMELIRREKIDLGVDLHEAAPEYPVINAIVFHPKAAELAALAQMELQQYGFDLRLEASPANLRGLSHREWGDHAGIKAVLLETANASQGRLKGKPSFSLIVEGKDKNYAKASKIGRLFVHYPDEGIPLKQRVAQHLAAVAALIRSLEELEPEKTIDIQNMPSYSEVLDRGIGHFLHSPKGS